MENNLPSQGEYKNLTSFKLAVLQNFPFIEADFDALTNYGLLSKIVEYLNDVISNENVVEENVTNLYNAFVTLHNYVHDYFGNLDVQDEINKKLDDMTESGELTTLISSYVDSVYIPFQNEINGRVAEQTQNINNLTSRMDTFTTLPSGSTSGDAELQDIRVSYTGKTYNNAGTSVRSQGSFLNSKTNAISNEVYNKIDVTTLNYQSGQISSNGQTATYNKRFRTTDFVKVKKGSSIRTDGSVEFNIAEFSSNTVESLQNYRTFGSDDYVVTSDCYIKFSIDDKTNVETFSNTRVQTALTHFYFDLIEDVNTTLLDTKINSKFIGYDKIDIAFEVKSYDLATDTTASSTNRAVTDKIRVNKYDKLVIKKNNGNLAMQIQYELLEYDLNGNNTSSMSWTNIPSYEQVIEFDNDKLIRLYVKFDNSRNIFDNNKKYLFDNFELYYYNETEKDKDIRNNINFLLENSFTKINFVPTDFEAGQISADGTTATVTGRFRTKNYIKVLKGGTIEGDGTIEFNVVEYATKNAASKITNRTYSTASYTIQNDCYIKISVNDKLNRQEFSYSQVEEGLNRMTFNLYTTDVVKEKYLDICDSYHDYNFTGSVVEYNTTNKLSTLYNLWDALMNQYSDYVSREVLGTASGYQVRCYTINSHSESMRGNYIPEEKMTILYVSSIHGNEHTIAIDDYMMFKDMLDNFKTKKALGLLFDNVTFKVIPTANPWGYENNSRYNANGVNLNRNFNADWEYVSAETSQYDASGSAPESEVETQILCNYIRSNKSTINMIITRHNTSSITTANHLGYVMSNYVKDTQIAQSVFRLLNTQLRNDYSVVNQELSKSYNLYTTRKYGQFKGTLEGWFNGIMDIHGFLVEFTTESGSNYHVTQSDIRRIGITSIISILESCVLKNREMLNDNEEYLYITSITN